MAQTINKCKHIIIVLIKNHKLFKNIIIIICTYLLYYNDTLFKPLLQNTRGQPILKLNNSIASLHFTLSHQTTTLKQECTLPPLPYSKLLHSNKKTQSGSGTYCILTMNCTPLPSCSSPGTERSTRLHARPYMAPSASEKH